MKTMYTECKSCGNRFDWAISQEDPTCERCKVLQGKDARKILELAPKNIPGQKELMKVLGLILDRLDTIDAPKESAKKGMFS